MNKYYKKESKIIIDEYQNVENMTILDIEDIRRNMSRIWEESKKEKMMKKNVQ